VASLAEVVKTLVEQAREAAAEEQAKAGGEPRPDAWEMWRRVLRDREEPD
jgi:hypothetical protein